MTPPNLMSSRRLFVTAALASPVLLLAGGCASTRGPSLTEAIRRLLILSSERAFDTLLAPGGFYDRNVARITLPPQLGGPGAGNLLSAALRTGPVKDRLIWEVSKAAARGAERAAPIIADTVRTFAIDDAPAIIFGGPAAATEALQRAMGRSLVGAMFPIVADGLALAENDVIVQALKMATGIDMTGLARHVSDQAHDAIYRAIASEEQAIRRDPAATRDPVLMAVLAAAR